LSDKAATQKNQLPSFGTQTGFDGGIWAMPRWKPSFSETQQKSQFSVPNSARQASYL